MWNVWRWDPTMAPEDEHLSRRKWLLVAEDLEQLAAEDLLYEMSEAERNNPTPRPVGAGPNWGVRFQTRPVGDEPSMMGIPPS